MKTLAMLPLQPWRLSQIRHASSKRCPPHVCQWAQLLFTRGPWGDRTHSFPLQSQNVRACRSFASVSGRQSIREDNTSKAKKSDDSSSTATLTSLYRALVESGGVASDPHQVLAIRELDRLRSEWLSSSHSTETEKVIGDTVSSKVGSQPNEEDSSFFSSLFSSTPVVLPPENGTIPTGLRSSHPPLIGVYLHGGVGCGKTFCMNLFYDSIPAEEHATKQKVHFHKFMLNVHRQMHEAKMIEKVEGDVLPRVIERTLEKGRLICFDEFQVTDVADALILRRLFTGLVEQGAVIVATSNRPPRDLYLNGLQRDLFLPFIDLLEERLNVVSMWDSDMDYRLVKGQHKADVYFFGKESKQEFESLFVQLTKGSPTLSTTMIVQGRTIHVPKASMEYGIARFSFDDLCRQAKGTADYLAIGGKFHTVFLEDVPTLSLHEVNLVRRFILLIDSLYECHVKVIVHAKTPPEGIFEVDLENDACDEAFAFDRTRSRLEEMRSVDYLGRKWTGSHQ